MKRSTKRFICLLLMLGFMMASAYAAPAATATAAPCDDTAQVDNTTALADGTYAPDSFSYAGGTGRVEISCTGITVQNGCACATIVFTSPNYAYVKADGQIIYGSHDAESSSFDVPVQLNADNNILGMTTAMSREHEISYQIFIALAAESGANEKQLAGLVKIGSMDLAYADQFSIDEYEGGYALIAIADGARYLVVPPDTPVPAGLDVDITVLRQPLDTIYLAATSSMALFDSAGALDSVRMSGLDADGWYVENARLAMQEGAILYGGKYSQPDYEMLIGEGCDLAVESTMILHSPEVKEMIELLGIPVLIDRSSYESHPLGRTEWIKLYGILTGHTAQAEAFFAQQAQVIDALSGFTNTEKTVAFFYVSTDGTVVVRSAQDYVPKMIEIAGGRYVFHDLASAEGARSSVNLTMEEFYAAAIDADYLVYNATIDDPIDSIDGLLQKSPLFADFKAVKKGDVWCTGKYLYQATDIVGELITDFNKMLTNDPGDMKFLYHID